MAVLTSLAVGALAAALLVHRLYVWLLKPAPIRARSRSRPSDRSAGIPHWPLTAMGDLAAMDGVLAATGARSYFFDDTARAFGPISQVLVGSTNLVIVSDAQEIEDIITRRSTEFDRSERASIGFSTSVPFGIISLPTDAMFRRHRKVLAPSMASAHLANFVPCVAVESTSLTVQACHAGLRGAVHALAS